MRMHAMTIALAACGLSFITTTAVAGAATVACQPVFEAMAKQAITPHRLSITETAAFLKAPRTSEVVVTTSAMYVQAAGAWHSRPYDAQEQVKEMREREASDSRSCSSVRDEQVGAEDATVYAVHELQDDGDKVDSQVWISKSRGLPLRQTVDMDVGGKAGKSHQDMRFDYNDVQPPAGVR